MAAVSATATVAVLAAGCGIDLDGAVSGDGIAPDGSTTTATVITVATTGETSATTATTATDPVTSAPALDATFAAIADRTMMTDEGRRLLALSSPELVDIDALGRTCTLGSEVSVLGCYRSGRIAVLDVTDPRLDGMVETTTAHELLHAAWAALNDGERRRLTDLLWAAFAGVSTPELEDRLDLYRQRDPSIVDNELHSILGTEVADLGPELEAHYGRWFSDRAAVVALATEVQATFTSLRSDVDALDARLADLRSRIDDTETSLEQRRSELETETADLQALREAGRIDEYNAAIDPHNEAVAAYNDGVAGLQDLIDEFNDLVAQRNALAADYAALVAEMDTTAATMPAG